MKKIVKFAICQSCRRKRKIYANGLCRSCYVGCNQIDFSNMLGICPYCGKRLITNHRGMAGKTCGSPECQAQRNRELTLKRLHKPLENGLCVDCKLKTPIEGQIRCSECAKRHLEKVKISQRKLKN